MRSYIKAKSYRNSKEINRLFSLCLTAIVLNLLILTSLNCYMTEAGESSWGVKMRHAAEALQKKNTGKAKLYLTEAFTEALRLGPSDPRFKMSAHQLECFLLEKQQDYREASHVYRQTITRAEKELSSYDPRIVDLQRDWIELLNAEGYSKEASNIDAEIPLIYHLLEAAKILFPLALLFSVIITVCLSWLLSLPSYAFAAYQAEDDLSVQQATSELLINKLTGNFFYHLKYGSRVASHLAFWNWLVFFIAGIPGAICLILWFYANSCHPQ